ncbi:CBN-DMD-10 protein [Caenorhabditis brenneri]|uniref:CBN-DMD-10 protein n=1 Tax=Caenorhabditis brenneri TaxID=135651 RepID=G0N8U2_CAEBE|nr:CBN-DMD-10 protein [Caenorhabditis brenneri]
MTQIGLYPAALTKPFELSLSAIKSVLEPENPSYSKRVPNCQKCGQHGRKSRLKGHKRNCPFRECPCAKCAVVTERQKLMADQIKIRRRQRKDTIMNLTREHITSTINAAAAFSNNQLNFNNLNTLLYGAIKTSPQPLLSSPTSSDASSYSPSLQFPSPSLSLIAPTSADQSPTSQTPAVIPPTTVAAPTPIIAPLPINPGFPMFGFGHQGDAAFLLQAIMDQYKLLDEAASMSISSSPSKDDDSGDEDCDGLSTDHIIDVCTV